MTQKDFTMSKLDEIEALYKHSGNFDLQDVKSIMIEVIMEAWEKGRKAGYEEGYDRGYDARFEEGVFLG